MKDSDIDYSDIPPLDFNSLNPQIAAYLRGLGRKGGQSKSAKKAESSRKNLEKGRAARKPKTEGSHGD